MKIWKSEFVQYSYLGEPVEKQFMDTLDIYGYNNMTVTINICFEINYLFISGSFLLICPYLVMNSFSF